MDDIQLLENSLRRLFQPVLHGLNDIVMIAPGTKTLGGIGDYIELAVEKLFTTQGTALSGIQHYQPVRYGVINMDGDLCIAEGRQAAVIVERNGVNFRIRFSNHDCEIYVREGVCGEPHRWVAYNPGHKENIPLSKAVTAVARDLKQNILSELMDRAELAVHRAITDISTQAPARAAVPVLD